MKTGNFWWLAAVVSAHDDHRVVGRTRLQKTVKLLQRLGMPTDYLFTMFFYGPYSEGLFRDIGRCGGLGLLIEVEHAGPEGGTPTFVLQATGEAEMEEIMTEVASRSMHYYLAKYGSGHFSPPPGPA